MEVFFFKYRKVLIVLCILLLLYLPFEIYRGIEIFNAGGRGQGAGSMLNAVITFLLVPVYLLTNIRKANKKLQEENATKTTDNTTGL